MSWVNTSLVLEVFPCYADFIKGMEKPYSISLYPGTGCADGQSGDHIIVAPAYTVTSEEIRQIVETTVAVITQFFAQSQDGEALPVHIGNGVGMDSHKTVAVRR